MATDTKTPTSGNIPPFVNTIIATLLRSPLHGLLDKSLLVLSFKGRKSGKEYMFPVGYVADGNELHVVSNHDWWKNLSGNVPVEIWFKGQRRKALADAAHGDESVVNAILAAVQKTPQIRKTYHIEVDADGKLKLESVRQAAQSVAFIRIMLK